MDLSRIAGAPISWGVCEVPGWGHQLPADRVLSEMRQVGLVATEFGPDGFLPDEPIARAAFLSTHDLRAVGGFLPVLLHDPDHDPTDEVATFLTACLASGADVMVLAATTGTDGYDVRPELDDVGWKVLLDRLDAIDEQARARGVRATIHPHMGTMIEGPAEVERVLAGSGIGLCLDTGHVRAGGGDPVEIATAHADRIAHVHLKDVDGDLADQVVAGSLAFSDAVPRGLWKRLGEGSVDVAAIVRALDGAGYDGWWVLEQDVMLAGVPAEPGPVADVEACVTYLRGLAGTAS